MMSLIRSGSSFITAPPPDLGGVQHAHGPRNAS
jgi:hypothetical protein